MTAPFIEGTRVVLRPVARADYEEAMPAWVSDREVVRYLVRGTLPPTQAAMAQAFDAMQASGDIELAIVARDSGRAVGIAGLHGLQWVPRHAEFRILIGERGYWGGGIGTEICQLLCGYAFEILNLNKVWLGVNAGNQRAARSYVKAGFTQEGVLRAEVYRNGRHWDVLRMSLLRQDYDAHSRAWPADPLIARQFRTG
ncbi:GNAT family N-acetyltransferase [Zavarzinia sp. CC-PAN008]|uniref:GNAT family N-acetyltransferase n=1 Tax=Zavarzinia sp. CC-PAN008 TaxID=3243332 RepID=UPI003F743A7A